MMNTKKRNTMSLTANAVKYTFVEHRIRRLSIRLMKIVSEGIGRCIILQFKCARVMENVCLCGNISFFSQENHRFGIN